MFSKLYLYLITLKDLILLFIYLINIFSYLIKSLLFILFKKRTLFLRNLLYISFFLKYYIYYFLIIIKTKNSKNLYLRCFIVILRGYYLFN
jgi:hypothetical protein